MKADVTIAPFPDNWTYLKAELAWLDRSLMRAMAKLRQTNQDIDRVARNAADKASSHWWKGFITLDPSHGGSKVNPPSEMQAPTHPLGRYGDRIAESVEQGIELPLPHLCQHLKLGKFERDVLILCLAPEISRRYEKLYAYLNNDETDCRQPTIDLALRLFCRSDAEWRVARNTVLATAPLVKLKILEILPSITTSRSLLSKTLHVSDKAVNYLLSDDANLDNLLPKTRSKRQTKLSALPNLPEPTSSSSLESEIIQPE